MTCDEYYRHHQPFTESGDRCNVAEIEASTARAVSVLGATITVNGTYAAVVRSCLTTKNDFGIFNRSCQPHDYELEHEKI